MYISEFYTNSFTMAEISFQQYLDLISQLEADGLCVSKHLPSKLLEINKDFLLPAKISNLSRKVRTHIEKGGDRSAIFNIPLKHEQVLPEFPFLDSIGLTDDVLLQSTPSFNLPPIYHTNKLVMELERFREVHNLSFKEWLVPILHIIFGQQPSCKALRKSVGKVCQDGASIRHLDHSSQRQQNFTTFSNQQFKLPTTLDDSFKQNLLKPVPAEVLHKENAVTAIVGHFGSIVGDFVHQKEKILQKKDKSLHRSKTEVKQQKEKCSILAKNTRILHTVIKTKDSSIVETNIKLDSAVNDLKKMKTDLAPKNLKRKLATKEKQLGMRKREKEMMAQDLLAAQGSLQQITSRLVHLEREKLAAEAEVQRQIHLKLSAQKRASKHKLKLTKRPKSTLVKDLKQQVSELEVKNDELQEQVRDLMEGDSVQTFRGNRYSDDVRLLYMDLVSNGVPTTKCATIVKSVLDKLSGKEFDARLPQKSFAERMLQESALLVKLHAATEILQSDNTTLATDGTTKRFKEYATFNVTCAGQGKKPMGLSIGFEELPAGDTENYFKCTRNIMADMAKLICPDNASSLQLDKKTAELLAKIKNTMSDRHIVNKCLNQQIQQWRSNLMPLVHENLDSLPANVQSNILSMNHLYCGLHTIINMGTVAKDVSKEFESIASSDLVSHSYTRGSARSCELLYELSKALTYTHDYQKAGVAHEWAAYLDSKGITNHVVCTKGERINVLFAAAAGAYFHRTHVADFLQISSHDNRLLQALPDLQDPLYLAVLKSLGIVDKLVTGPLFRLVECEDKHIFSLNNTWNHVVESMEKFSENPTPLLEEVTLIPDINIKKDEVYLELFKDSGDHGFDELVTDCLKMLCCGFGVLLRRQLADQLPGGEHYMPSESIMEETRGAPCHNMLTERDFSQLDRKLLQTPRITTLSLSGAIAFKQNSTGSWVSKQPNKSSLLTKVRKAAPSQTKLCQQKAQQVKLFRQERQVKKREAAAKKEAGKQVLRTTLTEKLELCGGLWLTESVMEENLKAIPPCKKFDAVVNQIRFRKNFTQVPSTERHLFNLSSAKRKFTFEELSCNLKTVLNSSLEPEPVSDDSPLCVLRSKNERAPLLQQALEKRKAKKIMIPSAKKMKTTLPQLEGRKVLHKWLMQDNKCEWWAGTVGEALGDLASEDCEFEIVYDGDETVYAVPLYHDWQSKDLILK